jgi:biotin carboxyl carrier protein
MLDGAMLNDPVEALSLEVGDGSVQVASDGASWVIAAMPLVQALGRKALREAASGSDIVAAMPGVVAKVLVAPGQAVRRGDVVVVQEAMKLMMPLAACIDGTVRAVHCAPGQIVANGALLVEIEPQVT